MGAGAGALGVGQERERDRDSRGTRFARLALAMHEHDMLARFSSGGFALLYGCGALCSRHFQALFSSKIFFGKMSTVAISFVFDKYCPIID